MSVRVTIETASRAEAELVARLLQPKARAESWRGYGVIRLGACSDSEAAALIETVSSAVAQHELAWARVRCGDDERVFRGNARHVSKAEPSRQSPSQSAPSGPRRSLTDLVDELTRDWRVAATSQPTDDQA